MDDARLVDFVFFGVAGFHGLVVFDVVGDAEEGPELVPVLVGVVLGLLVDLDDAGAVLAAEVFGVVDVQSDVCAAVSVEEKYGQLSFSKEDSKNN